MKALWVSLLVSGYFCSFGAQSAGAAEKDGSAPQQLERLSSDESLKTLPATILGDESSTLSKAQALAMAQKMAAAIEGAGVCTMAPGYTGRYAPYLPVNAVFVVEPVGGEKLRPFDLVVYTRIDGRLSARKVLSIEDGKVRVCDGPDGSTSVSISLHDCVGRIIARIAFRDEIDKS